MMVTHINAYQTVSPAKGAMPTRLIPLQSASANTAKWRRAGETTPPPNQAHLHGQLAHPKGNQSGTYPKYREASSATQRLAIRSQAPSRDSHRQAAAYCLAREPHLVS